MASPQNVADEFMKVINQCEGRVSFVTSEGDRLVANSMLSALVGISNILTVVDTLGLQFECERDEDCKLIAAFMKKHRLGRFARGVRDASR
jgi:hypothetical protein